MSELVSLCNIFSGRNDKMKKGDDEGCRDEDGSVGPPGSVLSTHRKKCHIVPLGFLFKQTNVCG
jgi:hypothetical protein